MVLERTDRQAFIRALIPDSFLCHILTHLLASGLKLFPLFYDKTVTSILTCLVVTNYLKRTKFSALQRSGLLQFYKIYSLQTDINHLKTLKFGRVYPKNKIAENNILVSKNWKWSWSKMPQRIIFIIPKWRQRNLDVFWSPLSHTSMRLAQSACVKKLISLCLQCWANL